MSSKCYEKVTALWDKWINEDKKDCGYPAIDELKRKGELDSIFATNGIIEDLYEATKEFLNILFNEVDFCDDKFKAMKKIALETSDLNKTFNGRGSYLTCVFIDNPESYINLPAYLLALIEKYGIKKYEDLTYDELTTAIFNNMDVIRTKHSIYQDNPIETPTKSIDAFGRYKRYEERVKSKKATIRDEKDFSVFAELDTYEKERAKIEKAKFSESLVRWTAVEFGDGYGYDVLSFDPVNMREKMIEVKSGISPDFILSRNEFKTAMKTLKQPNDEYYVHKYYRESNGSYSIKKLIFDKDELCFVNIANENDIYNYSPRWYCDENGKEIIEFVVMPQERYENFKNKRY